MKVKEFIEKAEGYMYFTLKDEWSGEILVSRITSEESDRLFKYIRLYGEYDVYSWWIDGGITRINVDMPN